MQPLEVHPAIEEDVIAAGIVREDLFNAAMSGNLTPQDELTVATAIRQQANEGGKTADEPANEDSFDAIVADMEAHKAAEQAKAEAVLLAEMEEAADEEAEASRQERGATQEEDEAALAAEVGEKSPEFNQAVFETAVRELIATNDPANLTPKGAPKAKAVSDLAGFEVKAIQITNFLKTLE
jgi:hypothetical protein